MPRKILIAFLIALSTFTFTACGGDEEEAPGEQVVYEKREGVVRPLGISIYQQGTHRLEKDGILAALLEAAGPQIDLDDFVGKKVEVEGIVSPTVEGNLEIIKVVAITEEEGKIDAEISEEPTYKKYIDSQFDFVVKYPTALKVQEARRGVMFLDEDLKIIEVIVLENKDKQELSQYLIDKYAYSADDLTKVSVAGLAGYQYQNTTGAVIYLASGDQIFTLVWYDKDENNRARNRRYYLELAQSFALGDISGVVGESGIDGKKLAKEGEFCGGIAGVTCATGLRCNMNGNYPDAGGVCVKQSVEGSSGIITADQVGESSDQPNISAAELQRGWYYGDVYNKKPGTPDTWILINSGEKSAMWRRPTDAPPEQKINLSAANTEASALSSDKQKVFSHLKTSIASYAPDAAESGSWELRQVAFADPNYVYAIYSAGEQTRRLLFVYSVAGGGVTLESQAYFKPGDSKDWLAIEGRDTAFGKALTIVDASGSISGQVMEGYRQFTNTRQGYSLQYPKNWYWQNATLTRTEFADKPFPAAIARITAEVVEGSNFAQFDEVISEGGKSVMYVQMTSEKSLKISGGVEDEEIIEVMGETVNIEG